jgi:hypothetical protein
MIAALLAAPASADSNVSSTNKFTWAENCGWMNWRDAGDPASSQGARFEPTFASGFVWCENIGWINLGDGTPGSGAGYSNTSGDDHGVNILADGELSGLAWGENVGWINFGISALVPPAQRPRIDAAANRLRGFVWGENIGWINLDDAEKFVAFQPPCAANCDGSTTPPVLNVNDFICFQSRFAAGDPYANCDGSTTPPVLNVNDFICFQSQYAAGCP